VVLVFVRTWLVHVARIPLVGKRRDRVQAPMNEDSELRIFIPGWRLVVVERFPVGAKRTIIRLPLDICQNFLACAGVLALGVAPFTLNRNRIRMRFAPVERARQSSRQPTGWREP